MSKYIVVVDLDDDIIEDYDELTIDYDVRGLNINDDFIESIKYIEGVKLKPMPNGEWRRDFDGNEFYWYCSNCKENYYEVDLYLGGNEFPNYCPNCGARMKGQNE